MESAFPSRFGTAGPLGSTPGAKAGSGAAIAAFLALSSDSTAADHTPVGPLPGADAEDAASYVERGSFAFGQCPSCGWEGPGRRSRRGAERDVADHTCS